MVARIDPYLSLAFSVNRVAVCVIAPDRIRLLGLLFKATYSGIYEDMLLQFPPYDRRNPTHVFAPDTRLSFQDCVDLTTEAQRVPFLARLQWIMHQPRR